MGDNQTTRAATDGAALLIIDMMTDLAFPGSETMHDGVESAAIAIERLRQVCRKAGVPIVYVNDNYDEWHSERSRFVDRMKSASARDILSRLEPHADDFFVIKPQFSGFYATNLPVLLPKLGVTRLILTGISTDICVLFTAADAHMREYDLWVPADCVASQDEQRTGWALDIMANSMKAQTARSADLSLADWLHGAHHAHTDDAAMAAAD